QRSLTSSHSLFLSRFSLSSFTPLLSALERRSGARRAEPIMAMAQLHMSLLADSTMLRRRCCHRACATADAVLSEHAAPRRPLKDTRTQRAHVATPAHGRR